MFAVVNGALIQIIMGSPVCYGLVKTGRQLFVKLKEKHRRLLEQVLLALKEFESPPICLYDDVCGNLIAVTGPVRPKCADRCFRRVKQGSGNDF